MATRHDEELRAAFDGQAERFERAPVQSDPALLARLVAFAALPAGAKVLDAGCGPGLVSEALLAAGHEVHGVDLSGEMIRRARSRCASFGMRARFEQGALHELPLAPPYDAAASRYLVHHFEDPQALVRRQAELVRPGGVVVASVHVADPEPARARWHAEIELARDVTHVRNLTSGELADAFARAGLAHVTLAEEDLDLDFDEWFDRGTPRVAKEEVRRMLLAGRARGFDPAPAAGGRITVHAIRALVRGQRR